MPQTVQALTSGYHLAWAAGAVLGAAAIAVAVIALRSPRRPQPDLARLAVEETSRPPAKASGQGDWRPLDRRSTA